MHSPATAKQVTDLDQNNDNSLLAMPDKPMDIN
jgi:hypothetical protein